MFKIKHILIIIAVLASLYQMVVTQVIIIDPYQHQSVHLGIILLLMFLISIKNKPRLWPLWTLLIVLSLFGTGYMFIFSDDLTFRFGLPNQMDMVIGVILVAVTLIALNEAFGKILPIFIGIFIAYTFFGQYLPSPFHHPPLPFDRIMSLMAVGFSGLYGKLLVISANYLFLFMVFAGLLMVSGATSFFTELGKLAGRKLAGGPAMSSIIASSLFGTVTGTPDANIIVTGSFTIPLMKKVGYTPEQAGAIEAAASTGGLIMPPIMGSSAFVMAGYLGVPYRDIMIMAFPAAILYYFGCGLYVQLRAIKNNVAKDTDEPDIRELLTKAPAFIIPLGVLVGLLLIGKSPQYSVFWAIIVTLAIIFFYTRKTKKKELLKTIFSGFTDGAVNGARVGVTLAALGVAMSTMTMTGLGMKLPAAVISLTGGNLPLVVIATMVVTIILGCGLPILPAYIIVALVAAPALIRLGVPDIQTHFFILYFAAFSMLTPPVAVSSLIASRLAEANYIKTSFEAIKISIAAYLVAFMFIWSPVVLLQPTPLVPAVVAILSFVLSIICLISGFVGYYFTNLTWLKKCIFVTNGIVLFITALTTWLIPFYCAVGLFLAITIWQIYRKKSNKSICQPISNETQSTKEL